MKTIVAGFGLLLACVMPVFGQLNTAHNGIRIGDVIIKQQVEYKNPGDTGRNKVWDFSRLKTINDAYRLSYSLPPLQGDSLYMMGDYRFDKRQLEPAEELIVGTEHNTMYYYRLKNDTLYHLGHENPSVRLTYTQPIVQSIFPLNYTNRTVIDYISKGLYSGTVSLSTQGNVKVEADAFGKMILPTGDTLNPVLRVKTTKLIIDTRKQHQTDTVKVLPANKGKQLETYQWYTKGYRYPIFETIRHINLADSTEIFSTAFFFPPQDHYYLDTDPENNALIDELWKEPESESKSAKESDADVLADMRGIDYKVYPNPVKHSLHIDYEIKNKSRQVTIQLYTLDGRQVKVIDKGNQQQGLHRETMDCSALQSGGYLLKLIIGENIVNLKIIKK